MVLGGGKISLPLLSCWKVDGAGIGLGAGAGTGVGAGAGTGAGAGAGAVGLVHVDSPVWLL